LIETKIKIYINLIVIMLINLVGRDMAYLAATYCILFENRWRKNLHIKRCIERKFYLI